MLDFYNYQGRPIAYIADDGISIYTYAGAPVAYLHQDRIYGYNGRCLGWFINGWVRDLQGNAVFFTVNATGGPVRPVKAVRPVRGVRGVRPVKSVRQVAPVRPILTLNWSPLSGPGFFGQ
jgi:hypothetical protein